MKIFSKFWIWSKTFKTGVSCDVANMTICSLQYEPRGKKTGLLPLRKQRRRSVVQ